jgi:hypothetical protein
MFKDALPTLILTALTWTITSHVRQSISPDLIYISVGRVSEVVSHNNIICLWLLLLQSCSLSKFMKIFTFHILNYFVKPSCTCMHMDGVIIHMCECSVVICNNNWIECLLLTRQRVDGCHLATEAAPMLKICSFLTLSLRWLKQLGWKLYSVCNLCCLLLHWIGRLRMNF